jgi:prevent-host-death family protein
MERVSISRLKDQLSAYLKKVQAGQTVLVMDRGTPVARLVGLDPGADPEGRRERLIASGVLKPGTVPPAPDPGKPVNLGPQARVLEALLLERREGR